MFQTIIIHQRLTDSLNDLSESLKQDINIELKCKQLLANQTIDPQINSVIAYYQLLLISTDDDTLEKWNANYTLKVLLNFPIRYINKDESDFLKDIIFKRIKETFHEKGFSLGSEIISEFKAKYPNICNTENLDQDLNNIIYCEVGNNFIDKCAETPTVISYDGTLSLNLRIDKNC